MKLSGKIRLVSEPNEVLMWMRVLALFSIVAAHASFTSPSWLVRGFALFGNFGVGAFLFISGYFFSTGEKRFGAFVLSRAKRVLIPWLFLGSIVYLFFCVMGSYSFSFSGMANFLIGYNSYLYFVPVIFLCYLLFFSRVMKNRFVLLVCFAVTIISLELTAFGVLAPLQESIHITNYMNMLNWIGYFALGILARALNAEGKIRKLLSSSLRFPLAGVLIGIFVLIWFLSVPLGYFSHFSWLWLPFGILLLLTVSACLWRPGKIIGYVFTCSYTVYLVHVALIGPLSHFTDLCTPTKIFFSLAIICSTLLLIWLLDLLARCFKLGGLYRLMMGVGRIKEIKK